MHLSTHRLEQLSVLKSQLAKVWRIIDSRAKTISSGRDSNAHEFTTSVIYLHKSRTRPSQLIFQYKGLRSTLHQRSYGQLLGEEELVFFKVMALVGGPCSRGQPHTSSIQGRTKGTQWVIRKRYVTLDYTVQNTRGEVLDHA